jgi:hypothetical protein
MAQPLYIVLPNIMNPSYIWQITIIILYTINSRLVPFLKFIYASLQISYIFVFVISFKLRNFSSQVFPFLVLKLSTVFKP